MLVIGRLRALAGLFIAAGLLLAACSADSVEAPSPQPSTTGSRDAGQPMQPKSCAGNVSVVASTGQVETITRGRSPEFTVRVGDTLRVEATGRCGERVRLEPGPGLDPASGGSRATTALKAGTTRLWLHHAMCDELPNVTGCRGGIAPDGEATIVVRP